MRRNMSPSCYGMGTKLCLYVKFNSIMFGLAHYPILIITKKHFYWMSCCFCDGVAPPCYGMVTVTSQIFIALRVITFSAKCTSEVHTVTVLSREIILKLMTEK